QVTLRNLRGLDAGFVHERILCFTVDANLARNSASRKLIDVMRDWMDKVRSMPGVRAVTMSEIRLLRGSGRKTTFWPAGQVAPPSEFMNSSIQAIGPDYFETLGQKLIEGRQFAWADNGRRQAAGIAPVIVNRTFVRRFGNNSPIIGRKFGIGIRKVAG